MPSRQTQQGDTSGGPDIEAAELQDGNVVRRSRSRRAGHGRTHSRTQSHLDPDADLPPGPERLALTSKLHPFWTTKVGILVAILIVLAIVGGIVGGVLGGRDNGGGNRPSPTVPSSSSSSSSSSSAAVGEVSDTKATATSAVIVTSSHSTTTTISFSQASSALATT